jgi:subtilisin-like proprotein convertase family protein
MKKTILLPFLFLTTLIYAQNYFVPISETAMQLAPDSDRRIIPERYTTFELDVTGLSDFLTTIPMEFTEEAASHESILMVPQADGSNEPFAVWKVMACEPQVYTMFPEIRTFAGVSLENPAKTIRGSVTMRGCKLMIMHPNADIDYVEPYAWEQTRYYMLYNRAHYPESMRPKIPAIWDEGSSQEPGIDRTAKVEKELPVADRGAAELVSLVTFRFGVSCTGEFAQDHGGTQASAFAAVVEYSNQVSAIFERDIHLRLQLVASSAAAMFTDPDNDPFTGFTVDAWMGQNPAVMDMYVNSLAYDVGHVYARYLGGSAIGVAGGIACLDSKGRGCSAGTGGYGDSFVNVIGQEVGHQLSGGHTWNRCNGTGGRNGVVAYSPGSGSTIMSYAGACGPDNVQGYSDLYYHSGSIDEISTFMEFTATCPTTSGSMNHKPEVTVPYSDNFFIPISTPFELDGSATDEDGDALVYAWEEIDLGLETPLSTPVGSSPLFRVWPATASTNRYFPRLSTILSNGFDIREQLPTYSRDLSFRLVAKDNFPNAGGVGWDEVYFRATADAGPFLVLSPNTSNTVWKVGSFVNVSWDVANTNQAPVNCSFVNIRLSTDGGLTYPIMLAENVVNDGSQLVIVPDNVTNQARVRVDAADNVFFDISNASFSIQQPTEPAVSIGLSNDGGQICLPGEFDSDIICIGVLGFSGTVDLEFSGALPPGAAATLSTNSIQVGESASLHIDLNDVSENGIFTFDLKATSNGEEFFFPITLNLVRSDFNGLEMLLPLDGTTNFLKSDPMILRWNQVPDADAYDVQFATSPDFDPLSLIATKTGTTLDTFKVPSALEINQVYYWRVRPVNVCGSHDWLDTYTVATEVQNCNSFAANDLPKFLTANGTPTIESKVILPGSGIINDINVKRLDGFHEFFKDLDVRLISPEGTEVLLFANKCGNFNGSFDFALDDEALSTFSCPPGVLGYSYQPTEALSAFDNENFNGTWTLRVTDQEFSSGGAIENLELEFCNTPEIHNPFVVNNETMLMAAGVNKLVTQDLLLCDDVDNTAMQLTYTLISTPKHGHLEFNWTGPMAIGSTFTQHDLNSGAIRYFNYALPASGDYFRFTVQDGEGGFLGTPKFEIVSSTPVGTNELDAEPQLSAYPNPASNQVWLVLNEVPDKDAQIRVVNTNGQLLSSLIWPAGQTSHALQLGALPAGMYLIQVQNADRVLVKRILLEK